MIGSRVGPYRLMELLGEGGMGEVYLAEQVEPVRRFVALKIIKLGMDSKQVIGRFETERQTLAMMEHPNIATVLDTGLSPEGRPYFAMEYVKGVPVTEYCDRHRLPMKERLIIFLAICEAVQHAHQKGIIHRDIKPSNVLVTIIDNRPVPKVIDFGVAKATARELTMRTLFTEHGQLVGTPEYMSPEQAEMTDRSVDTRTDIYSLGVLLYELIVGTLPFDSRTLREAGLSEIQRILREVDPPRPSTRLSTLDAPRTSELARDRATVLPQLRRQIEGDLDWITMRAMEKDRIRRYASASELAEDIRRHLRDEPVLASPPGRRYRIGKFMRRHRTGVVASALVTLALLAGIAGTAWQAIRARHAEDQARASEHSALEVNRFLLETLRQADPNENPRDHEMLVSEALDRASQNLQHAYGEQPRIEAAVRLAVGTSYRHLARYEESEEHLRRALELYAKLGNELPATLRARQALGNTLRDEGKVEESRALFEQCLADLHRERSADPGLLMTTYQGLANAAYSDKDLALADSLYQLALAIKGLKDPEDLIALLSVRNDYGTLLVHQGRWKEGRVLYERLLKDMQARQKEDHPWQAVAMDRLAECYHKMGDLEEAERIQREALAMDQRVYGEGSPQLSIRLGNLGLILKDRGKYEEANEVLRQAVDASIASYGMNHENTALSINNLGALEQELGDLDSAVESYEKVRTIEHSLYGDDPARLATVNNNLGAVYREKKDYRRALQSFGAARVGFVSLYGERDARVAIVEHNMGRTQMDARNYAAAETAYRTAIAKLEALVPDDHPNLAVMRGNLGENLRRSARFEEAERDLLASYAILEAKLGAGHKRSHFVADCLAQLYEQLRRPDDAAHWHELATSP